jgi:hypothetical protein
MAIKDLLVLDHSGQGKYKTNGLYYVSFKEMLMS